MWNIRKGVEIMTIQELDNLGFIYKKLTKHLYLVRLYADRKKPLSKIIIPIILKE